MSLSLADLREGTARLEGDLTVSARDAVTGETYPIEAFSMVGNLLVADVPLEAANAIRDRILAALVAEINTPPI
jgi:hypothetical protein